MDETIVKYLPPQATLETNRVLKQLSRSHRALAEIENIITTHDELFRAMSQGNYKKTAAKEVVSYRTALWKGH